MKSISSMPIMYQIRDSLEILNYNGAYLSKLTRQKFIWVLLYNRKETFKFVNYTL